MRCNSLVCLSSFQLFLFQKIKNILLFMDPIWALSGLFVYTIDVDPHRMGTECDTSPSWRRLFCHII